MITIYTDGSNSLKNGDAAWAFVCYGESGNFLLERSGYQPVGTNSTAELEAVLQALLYINTNPVARGGTFEVFTDSQYVMKCILGFRKWEKSRGIDNIINGNLIKRLIDRLEKCLDAHTVDVKWVRGHSGVEGNERADKLAKEARQNAGCP